MHSSPAVPTGTGCRSASTMWIWVFAIGLPMGTNARSLAGSHAHHVTSTAASVGPYRLWSSAGSRSKNRSWSALGSASPLQMTRREAGAVGGPRVLQEQLQHRRHEVDRGDPAIDDDLREVGAVAVAAGFRDHELRAEPERPEELPDRHIEAERRLLEDAVGRGQPEGLLHPHEAVGDRAVGDHRALRLARGARRVDDVGEVVERRAGGDVGRLAIGDGIGHAVHRHDLGRAARKPPDERLLGEQDRGGRVGKHERDPVGRILGVDGHVRRAGLEDRVQRDDHLERAVHADRHERARSRPQLDEVAGQPIRPAVQLLVRQGLVAEADRGRLRSPGHLRLERLVEESDGIVPGRRVPRRRRQLVGPQLRHPACPTGGASVPRNSGMSMPSPYRMPSRDSTAAAVPNRIETSIRTS